MSGVSLRLKELPTFALKVSLAIPAEKPIMEGFLMVQAKVLSREEVKSLNSQNMEDHEFFDELIHAVEGLGDVEGKPITGEAAIDEVKNGKFSMFLMPAIITAYFESYGEARRKNSRTSRSR